MKRKLIVVFIPIIVAIVVSCATILIVKNLKKPTYETVYFEISAALTPWQTMMVKTGNKYTPCEKRGDVYTASTQKIKGAFLRYSIVLADEWGNTYSDAVVDDAGEVISQSTVIKHTASFSGTLTGMREIAVNFRITSEFDGEMYLVIGSQPLLMQKTDASTYSLTINLGIGYHVYRCFLRINGENVAEFCEFTQFVVSKNNTSFTHHADFLVDTSRSITLTMTFSREIGSAYVIVSENGSTIKATSQAGSYSVTIDLSADCYISVVISTTDNFDGINYDAVYSAHTSTLSENEHINIELG